ncbi:MAG: response regulator transcription factor [Crocinitomicaceae bacterium]|nr:response regulator transcription factor [Crocinitomicaceae bacterium]
MTRIALLDKQELFRQSLESLFHINGGNEIVLSTGNFNYFQNSLAPGLADILIVDVKDLTDGEWDILTESSHHHPAMQIIALTELVCRDTLSRLMNCGVRGYYSKLVNASILTDVISEIAGNFNSFDLKLGPVVRDQLHKNRPQAQFQEELEKITFSDREIQILKMICQEMKNIEIAEILNISVRTVESHRRRMIEKTCSRTILGVVMYINQRNIQI